MADRPEGDGALATGVEQRCRGDNQSSVRGHHSRTDSSFGCKRTSVFESFHNFSARRSS